MKTRLETNLTIEDICKGLLWGEYYRKYHTNAIQKQLLMIE